MSTYRKRTQPKPTTAAGLRAQASASGNSIFRNRPRSIAGLFGNSQNSYSSLLGGSSYSSSSSPSSYLNKSSPTSSSGAYKNAYSNSSGSLNSYQNPYTTYGGTTSGYGALTLPSSHSSIGSLNLATPSTSYGYLNGFSSRSSPSVHRAGSFNKPKPKIDSSSFGSRSSSLQSLAGSEGYVVRDFTISSWQLIYTVHQLYRAFQCARTWFKLHLNK